MKEQQKPKIAVLRWEEGLVPEGLLQLERMKGNSTNPESYPFPVRMIHIPGACLETVITHPSDEVLGRMISMSKELVEKEGICGITTSCGFNVIFQKKLAEALPVPVFTSSLMQVPFAQQIIGKDRTVAVLTASKTSLTAEHLAACNITSDMNVEIFGLENAKEFGKIFDDPDNPFDMEAVEQEIIGAAEAAVKEYPSIGAFVLECTDLPPFAQKIRETTGLPVFDVVSLVDYMAMSLGVLRFY